MDRTISDICWSRNFTLTGGGPVCPETPHRRTGESEERGERREESVKICPPAPLPAVLTVDKL